MKFAREERRIFGRRELKELYATYGTMNLYNNGRFDASLRNLTTGKIMSSHHHCSRCEASLTPSCYDMPDPHYGFCPTWTVRGDTRECCGERFDLRSDGCGTHSRKQGFNIPFYSAASGEEVALSDFDDKEAPVAKEEAPKNKQEEQEIYGELMELYVEENGSLPQSFDKHFHALLAEDAKRERRASRLAKAGSQTTDITSSAQQMQVANQGTGRSRYTMTGGRGRGGTGATSTTAPEGKPKKRKNSDTFPVSKADQQQNTRSFAPARSKPKLAMEAPHQPAAERDPPEESSREKVQRIFDRAMELSQGESE